MTEPVLHHVSCPDASGGHRMAYWQWGDAAAAHLVVCVHGLSRQGRDFDVLARALLARAAAQGQALRVVCPDVVGRGDSDWLKEPMGYQFPTYVGDMLALLDFLEVPAAVFIGTSMGGLMTIIAANQAPGRVAAAVLNVPLRTYVIGTFLGIIPGTTAFSVAGSGLGSVIAAQNRNYHACVAKMPADPSLACPYTIDTSALVTKELILALALLGIVALIPVALKKWRARDAEVKGGI